MTSTSADKSLFPSLPPSLPPFYSLCSLLFFPLHLPFQHAANAKLTNANFVLPVRPKKYFCREFSAFPLYFPFTFSALSGLVPISTRSILHLRIFYYRETFPPSLRHNVLFCCTL